MIRKFYAKKRVVPPGHGSVPACSIWEGDDQDARAREGLADGVVSEVTPADTILADARSNRLFVATHRVR